MLHMLYIYTHVDVEINYYKLTWCTFKLTPLGFSKKGLDGLHRRQSSPDWLCHRNQGFAIGVVALITKTYSNLPSPARKMKVGVESLCLKDQAF